MCMSAEASFGAGLFLSITGAASVKRAENSSQILFASVPLIFAVQQIVEGFVWLSFTNPAYMLWREYAVFGFLFFAQVIWPSWLPVSILIMEKEKKPVRILQVLSVLGLIVSAYAAYCLFAYQAHARAENYHIRYYIDLPPSVIRDKGLLYMTVTLVPLFMSTTKRMWMFALSILLSYIFTKLFFNDYIISVWCFFAAVSSGMVYYILQDKQKLKIVYSAE